MLHISFNSSNIHSFLFNGFEEKKSSYEANNFLLMLGLNFNNTESLLFLIFMDVFDLFELFS